MRMRPGIGLGLSLLMAASQSGGCEAAQNEPQPTRTRQTQTEQRDRGSETPCTITGGLGDVAFEAFLSAKIGNEDDQSRKAEVIFTRVGTKDNEFNIGVEEGTYNRRTPDSYISVGGAMVHITTACQREGYRQLTDGRTNLNYFGPFVPAPGPAKGYVAPAP